jgi:hypothetical protein
VQRGWRVRQGRRARARWRTRPRASPRQAASALKAPPTPLASSALSVSAPPFQDMRFSWHLGSRGIRAPAVTRGARRALLRWRHRVAGAVRGGRRQLLSSWVRLSRRQPLSNRLFLHRRLRGPGAVQRHARLLLPGLVSLRLWAPLRRRSLAPPRAFAWTCPPASRTTPQPPARHALAPTTRQQAVRDHEAAGRA